MPSRCAVGRTLEEKHDMPAHQILTVAVVQVAAHRWRVACLHPSDQTDAMLVTGTQPGDWWRESGALAMARNWVAMQRDAGLMVELLHGTWVQCEDRLVRRWMSTAPGASATLASRPGTRRHEVAPGSGAFC